jgi:TonB family protein
MLGLVMFQSAKARPDTAVLFVKNSGQIVYDKASADYFIMVLPPDSSSGKNLYPVNGYYFDGKPRLVETVEIVADRAWGGAKSQSSSMVIQGPCINFYTNGHKRSIENYVDGKRIGDVTTYYPNGKIYSTIKLDQYGNQLLIACHDSTGKVLAENSNGDWLKFDEDFKKLTDEGPIKDGLEDGNWHGMINDTSKYEVLYIKGQRTSGIGYDSLGKAHPFKEVEVSAEFKGGLAAYYKFLENHMHYPPIDKTNNVQGKVLVTFMVKSDGSLTDIKALRGPDESLQNEAVRTIKLSPRWKPGYKYGMLAPSQYTLPISFSLTDNNSNYR